jgi:opacity protein-like surface antigen
LVGDGAGALVILRIVSCSTLPGAANVQTNFSGVTTTHTQSGWTAGGGIEWAFADGWTAKVEYLFVDLGNRSINWSTGTSFIQWLFFRTAKIVDFKMMAIGMNMEMKKSRSLLWQTKIFHSEKNLKGQTWRA